MLRLLTRPAVWAGAAAAGVAAVLVRSLACDDGNHKGFGLACRADGAANPTAAAVAAAAQRHFALLPLRMQAVQQPAQAAAAVSALSPDEWRAFKLVHKEALTKGVSNPTVRGEGRPTTSMLTH